MDYLSKGEVLTNTDLWTIFERNRPFVYTEKVLDLWVQLMKNGGKNKSVAFIILFSVVIHFDKCSSRITKDGGYHNNLEDVPLTFDN